MIKQRTVTGQAAPGCIMTLFGVTGDLNKRLLLPAIYNLASTRSLSDSFRLLGVGRKAWTDATLRAYIVKSLRQFWGKPLDSRVVHWLLKRTFYQPANFDEPTSFVALRERLNALGHGKDGANSVFYLALAPGFILPVTHQLARVRLLQETGPGFRRLIVEKPFGSDVESARKLNAELLNYLQEPQIYRIDHFAGKDAVQDLSVFRFCNSIMEPLWTRSSIDSVQITVAETVGVEGRAEFYEKSGALRDMVPNHLAELLSLVAMDPPISYTPDHVRSRQVELLQSVRRIKPSEVPKYAVRAQYGAGRIKRTLVKPYRREPGVARGSRTETYVAMRVDIDNWRWSGVPFFLRTGKGLCTALTEIAVRFREPPARLFAASMQGGSAANELIFRLQPNAGINWSVGTKAPGLPMQVVLSDLGFHFPEGPYGKHANGYERPLYDAMRGNSILFPSAGFVEAGWQMVQPLLDHWKHDRVSRLPVYAAGSPGPKDADLLLRRSGHSWRPL